jgi:hypothetical protein
MPPRRDHRGDHLLGLRAGKQECRREHRDPQLSGGGRGIVGEHLSPGDQHRR